MYCITVFPLTVYIVAWNAPLRTDRTSLNGKMRFDASYSN